MSAVQQQQQQPHHHHHHHHQSHHYQSAMSSQPQTPASPGTVQRSQSTRTAHVRQSSINRTQTSAGRSEGYQHSTRRDPDQHSTRMQPPPASYERRPDHNRQPSNMSDAQSSMVGTPGSLEEPGRSSQKSRKLTLQGVTGSWVLGKTIGAGSMGKVKIARKSDGSEQCAVKIVPRGGTEKDHSSRAPRDESKEIRTAREAAIMTLLEHPYICGMRDVVKTNNHWYMMLEYVNGGQMLDYIISHGRLKEKQARKFGRQIASALDYCHRNSIVHRDLKIENILISKTGDIKIIDFGLSNLYSPRSLLGTFCGSLYFAAPELLQAKPYLGPEVDVWSFGIVLYVLVCGKVPFDDQSMPALHAKIKRGVVDYPAWLTQDCKGLLSRMLVTDPRQRATLMEIMHHPWMNKGYEGPPKNHLPHRDPITLPLDPNVILAMTGFEFGSPENIQSLMTRVIESDEYQQAARVALRENAATPSVQEKKKGFQFDFYKRRSSTSSRDALSAPSAEALSHPYTDPLSAFHPLLSVYYLVKEKQERERRMELSTAEASAALTLSGNNIPPYESSEKAPQVPIIPLPEMAHTSDTNYDAKGEPSSPSRTRPRARTHGDEDLVDSVKQMSVSNQITAPTQPTTTVDSIKKESTAASLLRRFSTRRHSHKPDSKSMATPVVTVQSSGASPATSDIAVPRKSLSVRRARDAEMGGSQPNQQQFLSPEAAQFDTSSSSSSKKAAKLSRSTSVSEADHRRKNGLAPKAGESQTPHLTSKGFERPLSLSGRPGSAGKATASRANSTGHARRESYSFRRVRREEPTTVPIDVPEETDADMASAGSTDAVGATPSIDHVKPIFLKGLLSVSTTTSKPPPAIRADLMRVLREMGVEFREIKGGFSCTHKPSIDLATVQDNIPQSPEMLATAPSSHRRKLSFGGTSAMSASMKRRTKGENTNDLSAESMTDPSSQIQSELGGSMILQFEIYIVKVPLMNLYGIQQKKIAGNSWSYKNMITKIISELRL
ncbi:serine/threonine-protein kinase KIN2 [Arthrobotrys conoides]|uniref:non-specific serine/threonine protein kinase n=1 Tax=Arthrobotrys conoides TaxID=74498 RepID=A0AAN8N724_9PEZI